MVIDTIPKGQTLLDKKAYIFTRWWLRKNKSMIHEIINKKMDNMIFCNNQGLKINWKSKCQEE